MTFQNRRELIAPVVLLLLSVGACARTEMAEESGEEAGDRPESVDRVVLSAEALDDMRLSFATAEVREVVPSLVVPAELMPDPDRVAIIGSRVSGRIVEVRRNVGQMVRAGEPLVVIESVDVGVAVGEYTAATARAEAARRALERATRLIEDRIVSERRLEEVRAAAESAEAEEAAAATRLSAFGVAIPLTDEARLGRVTLASPLGGTVVARSASVGQWVEPSEQLAEVMNLADLWVIASVYERDIRHVSLGQDVLVEVRAYPGETFPGTVALVESTLDESSRSVTVRVVLPNADGRLRPGMFATARIRGTHAHEPVSLLSIPALAVQEVDGHTSVFVRDDEGGFTLKRVHLGEQAGELVEVLNGLTEGERVVVNGGFVLKGQLLRSSLGEDEG